MAVSKLCPLSNQNICLIRTVLLNKSLTQMFQMTLLHNGLLNYPPAMYPIIGSLCTIIFKECQCAKYYAYQEVAKYIKICIISLARLDCNFLLKSNILGCNYLKQLGATKDKRYTNIILLNDGWLNHSLYRERENCIQWLQSMNMVSTKITEVFDKLFCTI